MVIEALLAVTISVTPSIPGIECSVVAEPDVPEGITESILTVEKVVVPPPPPPPPVGDSYLEQQASTMLSGEWKMIHSLGECFLLDDDCNGEASTQYANEAVFDGTNLIQFLGRGHGEGSVFVQYDIANDQWSKLTTFPEGMTHPYDHLTFGNGFFYYHKKGGLSNQSMQFFDGNVWQIANPAVNHSVRFKGFDWNGSQFIITGGRNVYTYQGGADDVIDIGSSNVDRDVIQTYQPIDGGVYFTGKNKSGSPLNELWRVNQDLTIEQLADNPFNSMRVQTQNKGGTLVSLSDGSVMYMHHDGEMNIYHPVIDSWTNAGTTPMTGGGDLTVGVLLPFFDVTMYIQHFAQSGNKDSQIWLYKP